jgi:hypothetical protein
MDLTAKLNEFQTASSGHLVRAKFVTVMQRPVAENGHSRSIPAEVGDTLVSPRFRSGKSAELPVAMGGSFISGEPAREPLHDPTLAQAPLVE